MLYSKLASGSARWDWCPSEARRCFNEQVFETVLDYTVLAQATRRDFVYRFDTYQGCP